MRPLVLFTTVTLACTRSTSAQATMLHLEPVDSVTRAQVHAARDAIWRAWFAADTESLARLLPSAVAAGSRNGWESRDSTIAAARQFAAQQGRLVDIRFDSTSIRLRGSVAVVQSRYHLVLDQRGKRVTRTGVATEIFVRENGRWVNPFWYLE